LTPTATEAIATDEPTAEPIEPEPSPTEPEPTATVTPEPVEPTATPQPEPTATPKPTAEPAEAEGRVLLEERCSECHGLDRVERAQKSREEWVSTVDRMVGYGARLSDAETVLLLDYLVETYGP
jgi:mono/diheme cytochrome c family protein